MGEARNELYRYTSFEAIKRILSEDKHSMASLIGMTDFTECYYADDYIKKKVQMDVKERGKVYSDACKCFIVSCTNNEDENLKMWEDYGDKFKGVRISYCYEKLNKSDKFQIAKVSYASSYDKHPELDFIAEIQQNYGKHSFKINEWDVWQHFFKPYDYRNENETRILFYLKDDYKIKTDAWKWINKDGKFFPILSFEIEKFPYVISEIMLGRVGKDTFERNKAVLEQMLSVYKKKKHKNSIFSLSKF